jgi:hypothetical protein
MASVPGNSGLEVRNVEGKGRGVFACKKFAKGELIDKVPDARFEHHSTLLRLFFRFL